MKNDIYKNNLKNSVLQHCFPYQSAHMFQIWIHYHELCHLYHFLHLKKIKLGLCRVFLNTRQRAAVTASFPIPFDSIFFTVCLYFPCGFWNLCRLYRVLCSVVCRHTAKISLPCVFLCRVLFVVFTVCYALPCSDTRQRFLCCVPDIQHTAKSRAHGKVLLSRSEPMPP